MVLLVGTEKFGKTQTIAVSASAKTKIANPKQYNVKNVYTQKKHGLNTTKIASNVHNTTQL